MSRSQDGNRTPNKRWGMIIDPAMLREASGFSPESQEPTYPPAPTTSPPPPPILPETSSSDMDEQLKLAQEAVILQASTTHTTIPHTPVSDAFDISGSQDSDLATAYAQLEEESPLAQAAKRSRQTRAMAANETPGESSQVKPRSAMKDRSFSTGSSRRRVSFKIPGEQTPEGGCQSQFSPTSTTYRRMLQESPSIRAKNRTSGEKSQGQLIPTSPSPSKFRPHTPLDALSEEDENELLPSSSMVQRTNANEKEKIGDPDMDQGKVDENLQPKTPTFSMRLARRATAPVQPLQYREMDLPLRSRTKTISKASEPRRYTDTIIDDPRRPPPGQHPNEIQNIWDAIAAPPPVGWEDQNPPATPKSAKNFSGKFKRSDSDTSTGRTSGKGGMSKLLGMSNGRRRASNGDADEAVFETPEKPTTTTIAPKDMSSRRPSFPGMTLFRNRTSSNSFNMSQAPPEQQSRDRKSAASALKNLKKSAKKAERLNQREPDKIERQQVGNQQAFADTILKVKPRPRTSTLRKTSNSLFKRRKRTSQQDVVTSLIPLPDQRTIRLPVPKKPFKSMKDLARLRWKGETFGRQMVGESTREYASRMFGHRIPRKRAYRMNLERVFAVGGYNHKLRAAALHMHNGRYRASLPYYRPWTTRQWVSQNEALFKNGNRSFDRLPSSRSFENSYNRTTLDANGCITRRHSTRELRGLWDKLDPWTASQVYTRPPNSVTLSRFEISQEELSVHPGQIFENCSNQFSSLSNRDLPTDVAFAEQRAINFQSAEQDPDFKLSKTESFEDQAHNMAGSSDNESEDTTVIHRDLEDVETDTDSVDIPHEPLQDLSSAFSCKNEAASDQSDREEIETGVNALSSRIEADPEEANTEQSDTSTRYESKILDNLSTTSAEHNAESRSVMEQGFPDLDELTDEEESNIDVIFRTELRPREALRRQGNVIFQEDPQDEHVDADDATQVGDNDPLEIVEKHHLEEHQEDCTESLLKKDQEEDHHHDRGDTAEGHPEGDQQERLVNHPDIHSDIKLVNIIPAQGDNKYEDHEYYEDLSHGADTQIPPTESALDNVHHEPSNLEAFENNEEIREHSSLYFEDNDAPIENCDIVERLQALDYLFESSSEDDGQSDVSSSPGTTTQELVYGFPKEFPKSPRGPFGFLVRNRLNPQTGLIPLKLVPEAEQCYVRVRKPTRCHNNYRPATSHIEFRPPYSMDTNPVDDSAKEIQQRNSSADARMYALKWLTDGRAMATEYKNRRMNKVPKDSFEGAANQQVAVTKIAHGTETTNGAKKTNSLIPLHLPYIVKAKSFARLVRRTSMIRLHAEKLTHWDLADQRDIRQNPYGRRKFGPNPYSNCKKQIDTAEQDLQHHDRTIKLMESSDHGRTIGNSVSSQGGNESLEIQSTSVPQIVLHEADGHVSSLIDDDSDDDALMRLYLRGGGYTKNSAQKMLTTLSRKANVVWSKVTSRIEQMKVKMRSQKSRIQQNLGKNIRGLRDRNSKLTRSAIKKRVPAPFVRTSVFTDVPETPEHSEPRRRHWMRLNSTPDAIILSHGDGVIPTSTEGYAMARKFSPVGIPWVKSVHGDIRRIVDMNINKSLPRLPEVEHPVTGPIPNSRSWIERAFNRSEIRSRRRRQV